MLFHGTAFISQFIGVRWLIQRHFIDNTEQKNQCHYCRPTDLRNQLMRSPFCGCCTEITPIDYIINTRPNHQLDWDKHKNTLRTVFLFSIRCTVSKFNFIFKFKIKRQDKPQNNLSPHFSFNNEGEIKNGRASHLKECISLIIWCTCMLQTFVGLKSNICINLIFRNKNKISATSEETSVAILAFRPAKYGVGIWHHEYKSIEVWLLVYARLLP